MPGCREMPAALPTPRRQPQPPARTPATALAPCSAAWQALPRGAASSTGALPTRERRTPRRSPHALPTRDLHSSVPCSSHSDSVCMGLSMQTRPPSVPSTWNSPRTGILRVAEILLLDSSCKYPAPAFQARGSPRLSAARSPTSCWGIGCAAAAASLRCSSLTAF